ncbi:DNA polymerase III subunit gamma/tau [Thalassotalea sp. G2M2-11]|uniref:DNA polymerase III subunit gamma/tau n=1 Tax=Thalassotalea sp. G2M2-11 TaxID=2787627 RepID=UPI0019D1FB2B|nr:DNA polymerase III subunit gamma/tau [Thalassotalea sp. G2M2-11]
MSYQVLARKWRPKNFQELMGQEHVVTVLTNAIQQQRLHHAYLFTGTRGVGKTTIARIFAKSLNCHQGVTATPCGQCDACVDIDHGRFVDLLEIDAASRTKVDDTREILDNVQYKPTRGRYKVYLIDEVHMLSRSSFNALLKTLEEPPEHVKFILATTDPQKLPVTVLSRCLQFHLKALSIPQITKQLEHILNAEQVEFDAMALSLLAKAARGSMRDCLSLTDQAIAQGQGFINLANVQQMLGGVDHHWVYKILIALIKQDAQELMTLSQEIASYAPNYGRLLAELIQLLHQVAMVQVVDTHFDLSPEHNTLLKKFSQSMSPEDVQLYYQIALKGRKDLPYAADEQAAFDMVLLRLLAFKPQIAPQANNQHNEQTIDNHSPVSEFDDVQLAETEITAAASFVDSAPEALNAPSTSEADLDKSQHSSQPLAPQVNEAATETSTEVAIEANLAQEMLSLEQQAQQEFSDAVEPVSHDEHKPTAAHTLSSELPLESPERANQPSISQDRLEQSSSNETPAEEPSKASPIDAILANRNMLRSRKKALETKGKKSKDADERQQTTQIKQKKPAEDVPDITSIPDQPFTPEIIDPSKVKKANQVDKWANMIDAMALNGRLRQLALNATIEAESSADSLVLSLNQSTKHLKTEVAHQQLQQFVSEYFERPMHVEIRIVEQTVDDPTQIQEHINDKRYDYAKALLLEDDVVIALQEQFQAQLDEKTIIAR